MYTSSVAALSLLAASAAAKKCINTTVPVNISARQATFNIAVPQTNLEVTDFILNQTKQGGNFTNTALAGYHTTTGTYNISTQYCVPDRDNSTNPTIQVLTHGIGFDKTYWDLSYNDFSYSYIDTATDKYGYYTLSFDRLGLGNSSHGEPLNEIQSYLEIAATVQLTQMLRNGTFPGVNHTFSKVVHVGHSFGSAQTYSLANMYPDLTDGIILTGFSMNASFVSFFAAGGNFQQASLNQPLRFGSANGTQIQNFFAMYAEQLYDYLAPIDLTALSEPQNLPKGYLIAGNAEANKYLFFLPHYFDNGVLAVAEKTKQVVTLGELLTLGSVPMTNVYAGPVMVITGDADLPYCGGDCLNTMGAAASIPAMVKMNFPNVADSNFSAVIQPNTGHGINLHYNSTGAYDVINEYLNSKGLMSS